MSTAEDIKAKLLTVAANLPMDVNQGDLPLRLLFERDIVQRQPDMSSVYTACNLAAVDANAKALSLPAAIGITFDFASGGVFRFKRLRASGY